MMRASRNGPACSSVCSATCWRMTGSIAGRRVEDAAHSMTEPAFTLGIEEEYLLVDKVTRDLAVDPPQALFEEAQAALGGRVSTEFMRSQIEVGTGICTSLAE